MSLANFIATAAAAAERVLAPMCDPAGEGEFTLSTHSGRTFTGVMEEQDEIDPIDPAGSRRQRELIIVARRAQFATAPAASPRSTAVARGSVWSVQSVTPLGHHYRITCRPT